MPRRRQGSDVLGAAGTPHEQFAPLAGRGIVARLRSSVQALLAFCLAGISLAPAAADSTGWASRFQLSGFGTLSGSYVTRDDVHPLGGTGQPDTFKGNWSWKLDSLIGVQVNAKLSSQVDAAVQLVLQERPEQTLEESVEWAFLGWRPNADTSIRLGRVGLDFYLLSDYRNLSYAYLWQRPPIEFYGSVLPRNVDGLDISYRLSVANGDLVAKLFGGWTRRGLQLKQSETLDVIDLVPLWGGRLSYEQGPWRLSAGFAQVTFDGDIKSASNSEFARALAHPTIQMLWPQAADYEKALHADGTHTSFYAIGGAYDDGLWQISSEVGYLTSDWSLVRDLLSAYVSVGRRFGEVTPYAVLSNATPLDDRISVVAPSDLALAYVPEIALLYSGTDRFFSTQGIDQTTLSLGARWDFRRNVALKVQWDHTHIRSGDYWSGEDPIGAVPRTDVDVVSASLSWVF